MAISVRTAGAQDLPAICRLLGHLHDPATEVAWSATAWTSILDDPNRTLLLAVDHEEYPVGTAELLIAPNPAHEGSPRATVDNVVVDPAWRSRGVGRTLLHHALRRAEEAGCDELQAQIPGPRSGPGVS
jgi:ribosomal protein S18 acetylase RimI-like enzyme